MLDEDVLIPILTAASNYEAALVGYLNVFGHWQRTESDLMQIELSSNTFTALLIPLHFRARKSESTQNHLWLLTVLVETAKWRRSSGEGRYYCTSKQAYFRACTICKWVRNG
jgi:hypothetical protein